MGATKRSAAMRAPTAKKQKVDPMLSGVTEAIDRADDLPPACKAMLIAMVPGSLGTMSEERHEQQTMAVQMIGEVVESVQAKLQAALAEENAKLAEADQEKARHTDKVAELEQALKQATETVDAKSTEFARTSESLAAKKATLDEDQAAQTQAEATLEASKTQKATYEAAIENDYQALQTDIEPWQLEKCYAALVPLIKPLRLDDSFMTALPSACKRKAANRGSFDIMVMTQLKENLSKHVAALTATVEAGTSALAERTGTTAVSQQAVDEAQRAKDAAHVELGSAHAEHEIAKQALAAAMSADASYGKEHKELSKVRDEKQASLESFVTWNVECFKMLRDKTAKVPEDAKVEEEQPPSEVVEEDAAQEPSVA